MRELIFIALVAVLLVGCAAKPQQVETVKKAEKVSVDDVSKDLDQVSGPEEPADTDLDNLDKDLGDLENLDL